MRRHAHPTDDGDDLWGPYIRMIPTDFDTVLSQLPSQFVNLLPGASELVERQREAILRDWAAALNTRCVSLNRKSTQGDHNKKSDRGTPRIALAPFLDLLNHSVDAQIEAGQDETTGCFRIFTKTGCERGKEAFINYGPHDNLFLFAEYGFIVPGNTFDCVSVDQNVRDMDFGGRPVARRMIERELKSLGLFGDYVLRHEEESYRLLNAIRLYACIEDDDLKPAVARWRKVVNGELNVLSEDRESAARRLMARLLRVKEDELESCLSRAMMMSEADIRVNFVKEILRNTKPSNQDIPGIAFQFIQGVKVNENEPLYSAWSRGQLFRKAGSSECSEGQLTDTGKLRMLHTGEMLRKAYGPDGAGLIPRHTTRDFLDFGMYVRSTAYVRTIESVQYLLAGLLPLATREPGSGGDININLQANENAFPPTHGCARVVEILEGFKNACDRSRTHQRELASLTPKIKKYLDTIPPDEPGAPQKRANSPDMAGFRQILHVYDVASCHIGAGLGLPPGMDEQTFKDVDRFVSKNFWGLFGRSPELARLSIGRFLSDIKAFIEPAVRAKDADDVFRLGIFSGHDTTLGPMLGSLGAMSYEEFAGVPWFGSVLAIELLEHKTEAKRLLAWLLPGRGNREHFVRVRYNGKAIPLPGCSKAGSHFLGDPTACTYSAFMGIFRAIRTPPSGAMLADQSTGNGMLEEAWDYDLEHSLIKKADVSFDGEIENDLRGEPDDCSTIFIKDFGGDRRPNNWPKQRLEDLFGSNSLDDVFQRPTNDQSKDLDGRPGNIIDRNTFQASADEPLVGSENYPLDIDSLDNVTESNQNEFAGSEGAKQPSGLRVIRQLDGNNFSAMMLKMGDECNMRYSPEKGCWEGGDDFDELLNDRNSEAGKRLFSKSSMAASEGRRRSIKLSNSGSVRVRDELNQQLINESVHVRDEPSQQTNLGNIIHGISLDA
ncbi:hypothetical protein HK101_012034 [Irineochytrium annulatum]|nr:hypothetical protein HK101_012034 [Irineochytrium annulatum]